VLAGGGARVEKADPGAGDGTSSGVVSDLSPEGGAVIRFFVAGGSGGGRTARGRVYRTGGRSNGAAVYESRAGWAGSRTSWDNRPRRVGGPLEDKGVVTTGWQDFDVTGWISGDGTYSFVLAATSSDGLYMSSRERAGFAPQLVLTVADAPTALGASAGPDRV